MGKAQGKCLALSEQSPEPGPAITLGKCCGSTGRDTTVSPSGKKNPSPAPQELLPTLPVFLPHRLLPTQAGPPDRRPRGPGRHGAGEPGGLIPLGTRSCQRPRGSLALKRAVESGVNHSFQGLGVSYGRRGGGVDSPEPPTATALTRPGRGRGVGSRGGAGAGTADARASSRPFITRPVLVPPDSGSLHPFPLPLASPGRLQPNHPSLRSRGILLTSPPALGHDDPYRPPGALPRGCCRKDAPVRLGPRPDGGSLR